MVDILIRNVSPELHRALKVKAVREGVTLSEYLRRIAERQAEGQSRTLTSAHLEALAARQRRFPPPPEIDFAASIRESRNERDAQIETAIYGKPLPKTYPDE